MWELNGRRSETTGGLRDRIDERERPADGFGRILYIHGHNKTPKIARKQAERLCSVVLNHPSHFADRWRFGLYLWPPTQRGRTLLSWAEYPKATHCAQDAGRLLADHFAGYPASYARRSAAPSLARTVLIGHSLGAVVALSAAQRLATLRDDLAGLVLTGAAVPSLELCPRGQYGLQLAEAEYVAYCEDDRILRDLFPMGERMAAPFRATSHAVGLYGEPTDRPWKRAKTSVRDHKYWRRPETASGVAAVISPGCPTGPHPPAPHRQVPRYGDERP